MPTHSASSSTSSPPGGPRPDSPSLARQLSGLGRTFWVANAIYFLDGAAYFGVLNILTLFLGQSVGLSDEGAGRTVGMFSAGVTLTSALFGGTSDRLGISRGITVAIVAALVGRLALTLSPGQAMPALVAFAGLAAMAFSAGALQPAVYAAIKQTTNKDNEAFAFSLPYALMNGGILLESLASSLVRERWGTQGVFWMVVGITVVYLVVHLVFFPRDVKKPVVADAVAPVRPASSWRDHALLNPRFLFFIFVLLGVRTLFAHQFLTMPDYVTRAYPADVGARYEWITGINPLIILFGTPLLAAVTRRIHVVDMMIAGTLVSAAATFLLVPGPSLSALLAYVTVFSIGEALWSSRFLEYVASIAPEGKVGNYVGVAQIPWFFAKVVTSGFSGLMLARYCPKDGAQDTGTLWLVYALIGLTSPIGLVLARRWLRAGDLKQA